jgi:hypothetical protein
LYVRSIICISFIDNINFTWILLPLCLS